MKEFIIALIAAALSLITVFYLFTLFLLPALEKLNKEQQLRDKQFIENNKCTLTEVKHSESRYICKDGVSYWLSTQLNSK